VNDTEIAGSQVFAGESTFTLLEIEIGVINLEINPASNFSIFLTRF
jgi:hypothetical protein